MKILAFIPARGGSIGIKNKNLTMLAGKPLIQHTIDIVKKMNKSLYPFVSSNDKKIIKYCNSKGLKTEYKRPLSLSKSNSNVIDAIIHGVDWLKKYKGINFETIIILQPTTPLRYLWEIKKALKDFKSKKTNSMVSATPMREHPYECIEKTKNNWKFIKKAGKTVFRRQQFKKNFYFVDGSFYIIKTSFLKKYKKLIKQKKTEIFILKRNWPIDIDYKEDLLVANALIKKNK